MKSIPHFREVFHPHLRHRHIPARCAIRVKILTDRIVKLHTYPVAYGGFSDVWSCQLRHKQKPPKKVRFPGKSIQQKILTIGLLQVAVKAIRPAFASKEEFQIKRKVTSVQAQGLL